MTTTVPFYQLALGARFTFFGRAYTKIGMSMADDDKRDGYIFMGESDVLTESPPLLLPPEVAARWKPREGHWWKTPTSPIEDTKPEPEPAQRRSDATL